MPATINHTWGYRTDGTAEMMAAVDNFVRSGLEAWLAHVFTVLGGFIAHIIERPRLIERLEEDGGSRVAVFAAPAGYGKTTLLAQWAERRRTRVA